MCACCVASVVLERGHIKAISSRKGLATHHSHTNAAMKSTSRPCDSKRITSKKQHYNSSPSSSATRRLRLSTDHELCTQVLLDDRSCTVPQLAQEGVAIRVRSNRNPLCNRLPGSLRPLAALPPHYQKIVPEKNYQLFHELHCPECQTHARGATALACGVLFDNERSARGACAQEEQEVRAQLFKAMMRNYYRILAAKEAETAAALIASRAQHQVLTLPASQCSWLSAAERDHRIAVVRLLLRQLATVHLLCQRGLRAAAAGLSPAEVERTLEAVEQHFDDDCVVVTQRRIEIGAQRDELTLQERLQRHSIANICQDAFAVLLLAHSDWRRTATQTQELRKQSEMHSERNACLQAESKARDGIEAEAAYVMSAAQNELAALRVEWLCRRLQGMLEHTEHKEEKIRHEKVAHCFAERLVLFSKATQDYEPLQRAFVYSAEAVAWVGLQHLKSEWLESLSASEDRILEDCRQVAAQHIVHSVVEDACASSD